MRVEVLVSDPNRPASIDKQGKLLINFVESCRHGPGRLTFAMLANPLVIEGQSDLTRESTFISVAVLEIACLSARRRQRISGTQNRDACFDYYSGVS